MTRTTNAAPQRRIAIIGIPRPQQTRLGMIRPARMGEAIGWCTVTDEAPESSGNFLATALMRQRIASQQTPGTLLYTPAPHTPNMNLAPWNLEWTRYRSRHLDTPVPGSFTANPLLWFGIGVAASVTAAALMKGRR